MKKRHEDKVLKHLIAVLFIVVVFGGFFVSIEAYSQFSPKVTGWAISTFGANINSAFISPTPDDASSTTNINVEIKVNLTDASDLNTFIYNWDSNNYTFYDNNLLLMLNFDNISALGENSTLTKDVSSQNIQGTILNNASWLESEKYNGAFNFSGDDSNQGISLSSTPWNNAITYTYIFWIKPDNYSSYMKIMGSSNSDDGLYTNNGNVMNYCSRNNSYLSTPITYGEWIHFVYSWNGTATLFYINGVLSLQNSSECSLPLNSNLIGKDDGLENFRGLIDEVRIYNRSLSSDEIQQQYLSNFRKYDTDKWEFYTNQTNLTAQNSYTYFASAQDTSARSSTTETRTISITSSEPQQQAVPEFSDYAIILISIISIGGFFVIKQHQE